MFYSKKSLVLILSVLLSLISCDNYHETDDTTLTELKKFIKSEDFKGLRLSSKEFSNKLSLDNFTIDESSFVEYVGDSYTTFAYSYTNNHKIIANVYFAKIKGGGYYSFLVEDKIITDNKGNIVSQMDLRGEKIFSKNKDESCFWDCIDYSNTECDKNPQCSFLCDIADYLLICSIGKALGCGAACLILELE